MSPPGRSTDRGSQDWGGASDQSFASTKRDRKKWKPFQQGRGNRGHRNGRQAPRPLSDTRRQQQAPAPEPQRQLPPSNRAESGLPITNVSRPGPLPPDHPLKREMDELKATRKKRQFYWAGLIEDLGDDEWGNPANYDRQRWEDEERLADKKFEELAGQIKLVEMGYPLVAIEGQDQSRSTSTTYGLDRGHVTESHRGEYSTAGRAPIRLQLTERQHGGPLHHGGRVGRLGYSLRGSNSNTPPKELLPWTQRGRASAVNKWMDQMGMNTSRTTSNNSTERKDMIRGATFLGEHVATNDDYLQQDGDLNDLRAIDNSEEHYETVQCHDDDTPPLWTALDEVAFEDAEREREEERLLLGQYLWEDHQANDRIEKDTAFALQPFRVMTLVDFPEEGLPREQTNPPVAEPDLMSALMNTLIKKQAASPYQLHLNPPASSREANAINMPSDLILRPVSDQSPSSRTSIQRQSSTQPPSTGLNSTTASGTDVKVTRDKGSSIVPESLALPVLEAVREETIRQDRIREQVTADFIEEEEQQIERLDMRNDTSSNEDEASLPPEPYAAGNNDHGFIHIEDIPDASSPISVDSSTPTVSPPEPYRKHQPQIFSALGLHYRATLKVDEMFSTTGRLLPPEPDSVAVRLRGLRGSFEEYSSILGRWASARRDEDEVEGEARGVVEGVSNWVNDRVWLVDWRQRLTM